MAQALTMPKFGQTVEESTILNWLKKEGDHITKGEMIFEIETDKASMEVESFVSGTLLKILVKEGETVPVQSPVAVIGEAGESFDPEQFKAAGKETPAPAKKEAAPAAEKKAAPAEKSAETAETETAPQTSAPTPAPSAPAPSGRLKISPRARKLARDKVIDPSHVQGTGPGGRIIERDIQAYLESKNYDALRISPAAKALAADEKLDILTVKGSGEQQRITVEDIKRAVAEKPQPMNKMRQVIASRLTQSFATIPHFYVTVEVDMTDLLQYRKQLKADGHAYTITDFIMESVILSLKEFPDVNSSTDGRAVTWSSSVNLGLAVSLEKGLVVPVIQQAEDLSMQDLHDVAAAMAVKAREGKLTPDEMTGSSFTISNMGMLGVDEFHAIINPGEGAILAVASTVKKPVVKDDEIAIRSMMKISLSADHRIVDGAMGAQFVNAVKARLEDIDVWKRAL